MRVVLTDDFLCVHGWRPSMDSLVTYDYKFRKTPEEIKQEKEELKQQGISSKKVNRFNSKKMNLGVPSLTDASIVSFLPGLWTRIKQYLERNNIEYELDDQRDPAIRPEPDYSVFKGETLRYGQADTFAAVALTDGGIILAPTGYGKSYSIKKICSMYPTLNILIVSKSAQVVGNLYDEIRKELPGQVGYVYAKGHTAAGKRVVITTAKSLEQIPTDKAQLILCDEVHDVGNNQVGEFLGNFTHCRKFGFTATLTRNDNSLLVTEALFGPVIQKITYQEAVANNLVVPMKYLMIPVDSCGKRGWNVQSMSETYQKKNSYWVNSYRNREIASLVYRIKELVPSQILIMVETLEHAIQLHRRLPWFKVIHSGQGDVESQRENFKEEYYPGLDLSQYKLTPTELDIARNAFAKGTLRYVISTYTWKQGVNFVDLAIMIRADASPSEIPSIQAPGRASRISSGKYCGYVVDFRDTFNPWASTRSDNRERIYQGQGWEEITAEQMLQELCESKGEENDKQ